MQLIFKIGLIIAIHLAVFLCYPDTGEFGGYYLAISIVLWTGFMLFINLSVKIIKFISGALGHLVHLALLCLMLVSIALTLPQADRVTVFEKVRDGKYPTKETIQKGLNKLGLAKKNIPAIHLRKINEGLEKVLDKIEEKSPETAEVIKKEIE
jgi:cell division protein FtsW (lipid II flippase)